MAKVVLRLYTTLKDMAQSGRLETEAENVESALESAVQKFGKEFGEVLFDGDKSNGTRRVVRNCFSLVVNSQMIGLKDLDQRTLKDGDMIHIFPPIAGGTEVEQ